MKKRINKIILILFLITAKILEIISRKFKISYETVNIILYYVLIPLILGFIISIYLFIIILIFWIIIYILHIPNFSQKLFVYSQQFILFFGVYFVCSVFLCIFIPIVITIILLIIF